MVVKLPNVNVPKVNIPQVGAGTGSLESMKSVGLVFMAPTFRGEELTRRDIRGACCFLEGAAGVAWGASADAMIFGMNPAVLAAGVATSATGPSWLLQHAVSTATGYLVWSGVNFGFQGGFGVTGYLGALYA